MIHRLLFNKQSAKSMPVRINIDKYWEESIDGGIDIKIRNRQNPLKFYTTFMVAFISW